MIGRRHGGGPGESFVICPNMLGKGFSTSPSNTRPLHRSRFPKIHHLRQVRLQNKLSLKKFGSEKIKWERLGDGDAQRSSGRAYSETWSRSILPLAVCRALFAPQFVFLEGGRPPWKAIRHANDGLVYEQPKRGPARWPHAFTQVGLLQVFYRKQLDSRFRSAVKWQGCRRAVELFKSRGFSGVVLGRFSSRGKAAYKPAYVVGRGSTTTFGDPKYGGNIRKRVAESMAKAIVMPASTESDSPAG